jgi:hypothetical protein
VRDIAHNFHPLSCKALGYYAVVSMRRLRSHSPQEFGASAVLLGRVYAAAISIEHSQNVACARSVLLFRGPSPQAFPHARSAPITICFSVSLVTEVSARHHGLTRTLDSLNVSSRNPVSYGFQGISNSLH